MILSEKCSANPLFSCAIVHALFMTLKSKRQGFFINFYCEFFKFSDIRLSSTSEICFLNNIEYKIFMLKKNLTLYNIYIYIYK